MESVLIIVCLLSIKDMVGTKFQYLYFNYKVILNFIFQNMFGGTIVHKAGTGAIQHCLRIYLYKGARLINIEH